MATQTRRAKTLLDDPGIWFAITIALVIITLLFAGLAGLGLVETAVAVLVVGGVSAARLPAAIAVALGVVAWAFFTGFFENAFGQLTFAAADLERLALFAVATAGIAHFVRPLRRSESRHG